jgi:hypothetical protein
MDLYVSLALAVGKPLLICAVAIGALAGLFALVYPQAFVRVARKGNYWVDTRKLLHLPDSKLFQVTDKWVDTDQYALRFTRLTGAAMLVGAAFLVALCYVAG